MIRRRLLTIDPGFSVEAFLKSTPYERAEEGEHFAQGLRLAGVLDYSPVNPGSFGDPVARPIF